ncbi:MAG TPA: hypothetical protein VMI13_09790 [Solirubrobacteraceae bacterium]|nr:hypothetical protein [Solirubrobacteraceae bacterium]
MRAPRSRHPYALRRLALALGVAAAITSVVLVALGIGGTASRAAFAPPPPTAQTDDAVPAGKVTMIAATPEEAGAGGGETWGIGREVGSQSTNLLVRYTSQQGWLRAPSLPEGFALAPDGLLAARMTPSGAGAMLGTIAKREVVLVRDPGGSFVATAAVPAEGEGGEGGEGPAALLAPGEELFESKGSRGPLLAALDEPGGVAGALVAPERAGSGEVEHQVLHWDGTGWTSEPIEIPAASGASFRILAIGASSPQNAWLLGQLAPGAGYPAGAVALFRRIDAGGSWEWRPAALEAGGGDAEAHPLYVPLAGGGQAPFGVPGTGQPPGVEGQVLTVTAEGVWIDGTRSDVAGLDASTTLFFQPEGSAGGSLQASWCLAPPATPSACSYTLPQPVPRAQMRSIAWPGGGPYGRRVITGLPNGISLRLEGSSFVEVLSLGGGAVGSQDPGAALGAAFSSPTEGWLGEGDLPVHLTASPEASQLRPWPVTFRRDLQALAPAPRQPVAALGSEALAVGLQGAVTRYKPGLGWIPESLFGPGENIKHPNLRSVAWPTPNRAYAVGDEGPAGGEQMWLWRGETGLWEPDPATPIDFRGNLLGIAFDPSNPARGYAVGTTVLGRGGMIMRYGKSWSEETSLPGEAQGAQFLGIAFAGSEALVPYVKQLNAEKGIYAGGLLVNSGSGWHVDSEATELMKSTGTLPFAVAGLADGGAAFAASGSASGPKVFEREGAGGPWRATPTPLPGVVAGSLALFREGGALRAIVTGSGGRHVSRDFEEQVPPGAPALKQGAIETSGGPEAGAVLRQTGTGWRDERHEVQVGEAPPGNYEFQDLPYTPDPVMAVLVDPSGGNGWTVGGHLSESSNGSGEALETADVERYGENGRTPEGETPAGVPTRGWATFAIGGNAECFDPCAERALAGVGPQVWLGSAVSLAATSGARAFIYTGPSVTEGRVEGHRSVPIPFAAELERTRAILASGAYPAGANAGEQLPAYSVASPPDLDNRPASEGTEQSFQDAFAGFPQQTLVDANGAPAGCTATIGCEGVYYAFSSQGTGGRVRVIVLDETTPEMGENELIWLEGELQDAKSAGEPAIAIGAGDIEAQIRAGRKQSAALAKILVTGSRSTPAGLCARLERERTHAEGACSSASAYFYDAREQNEHKPLRAGGESIEAYGSGTLGYINQQHEQAGNFHGASGILLAQVNVASRSRATNRAELQVPLIPVVGELALEARQGTLLPRSQPAVFDGLARRPRAGCDAVAQLNNCELDPYIPIPSICTGECGGALLPEYGFKSSDPEIGAFVERNLGSTNPLAVLQNGEGKPIIESEGGAGAKSGLFCAFNPGTTTVTITAGAWSASLPVTVQRGSVRQPCGTVKLSNPPAVESQQLAPAPPPSPPTSSAPSTAPTPLSFPPPPAPPAPAPAPVPAQQVAPFFAAAVPVAPVLAIVPPPIPTPARPSPPSGTSAVTSPVEVVEEEEEQEEAPESVSNQAVAYRSPEGGGSLVPYLLGAVLLAALAGASARRPRGRRGESEVVPATVSTARTQRRLGDMSRDGRRRRR